jgi:hypothetical protein
MRFPEYVFPALTLCFSCVRGQEPLKRLVECRLGKDDRCGES